MQQCAAQRNDHLIPAKVGMNRIRLMPPLFSLEHEPCNGKALTQNIIDADVDVNVGEFIRSSPFNSTLLIIEHELTGFS